MQKYVLIHTDGYSISNKGVFDTLEDARKKMTQEYLNIALNPDFQKWVTEDSGIEEDEATLKVEAIDVYLWKIVEVKA